MLSRSRIQIQASSLGEPRAPPTASLAYRRNLVARLREHAIQHAKRVCRETPRRPECAIAWDLVEDYDHALRRIKDASPSDTLEAFCLDSPSDLECRVYDL